MIGRCKGPIREQQSARRDRSVGAQRLSVPGGDHGLGSATRASRPTGRRLTSSCGRSCCIRWRQKPVRVLEIGSWEGRSALFFLNFLPRSRIVCVDPFGGSVEHQLDPYYAEQAANPKAGSTAILPVSGIAWKRSKAARQRSCPNSAFPAGVSMSPISTAATWPPTSMPTRCWPGRWSSRAALLIFDDYEWGEMDTEHERPKLGIDAFLKTIEGRYRELHRGWQIAIAKTILPARGRGERLRRVAL